MATTYTVKKGDTLSEIARQLGVKTGELTGFRSGDPNLIYPGEQIKVKAPSYAGEVSTQLKSEYGAAPEPAVDKKPEKTTDLYDVTKLRDEVGTYKTEMDKAFKNLKDIETRTFNEEYEKRGLSDKKGRISSLDSEITALKRERDEAVSKIRQNPGLSAAQMLGQVKKIADFQNDRINSLIAERNAAAGEYNTELGEIDRTVERAAMDPKRQYEYYAGLLSRADTTLGGFQKALADELKEGRRQEEWERELAQALQIAQMRGTGGRSSRRQLVRDEEGLPLYWFDPDTQAIEWIDESQMPEGRGRGESPLAEVVKSFVESQEKEREPGLIRRFLRKIF